MREYSPQFDFRDSPTLDTFLQDWVNEVQIVLGPLGSGKSYANCVKLMMIAAKQDVDPRTNTRRSRFAIIRNTSPELKTTTIKTWQEVWPEAHCGPIKWSGPIVHRVQIQQKKGKPGIDAEFIFIPLDSETDVKKLRSLDITAAWINEGSEILLSVIEMVGTRVGRFPPRDDKLGIMARYPFVMVDSNASDEDHWIAKFDMGETPQGWGFYKQPPAVLEVHQQGGKWTSKEAGTEHLTFTDDGIIRSAGRQWVVSPNAENQNNLVKGYYRRSATAKRMAWIQRNLQVKYVYVLEGKPVIEVYRDEVYAFDDVPLLKDQPVLAGLDIGGGTLNPAAVLGQRHERGVWLIHAELFMDNTGAVRFAQALKALFAQIYGSINMPLETAWGDPAGAKGDDLYETAIFDHFNAAGIPAFPCDTNDIKLRIEAITAPMERMIDGKPGIMIHKRCTGLRTALSGKWNFRRLQISGTEAMFQEKPSKNHPHSDLGDALGYLMLGGGEHESITSAGQDRHQDMVVADGEYSLW